MAYGETWSTGSKQTSSTRPSSKVRRTSRTRDSHMIQVVSIWVVGELEREESCLWRFSKAFSSSSEGENDNYLDFLLWLVIKGQTGVFTVTYKSDSCLISYCTLQVGCQRQQAKAQCVVYITTCFLFSMCSSCCFRYILAYWPGL